MSLDKIDPFDRVQALKHSRKYSQDYRKYQEEKEEDEVEFAVTGPIWAYQAKLSKAARKLCHKWNLRYPINPDTPADEDEIKYLTPPVKHLTSPELWHKPRFYTTRDNKPEDRVITHVSGQLVLMIDLGFPRSQIKEALEQFLDHHTKKGEGRIRENPAKWEIYQMHAGEGKPLLQITREIYNLPEDAHPAYDENADLLYKRVKRAYRKACQIIKLIENPTV
jgi:hypothetical protein